MLLLSYDEDGSIVIVEAGVLAGLFDAAIWAGEVRRSIGIGTSKRWTLWRKLLGLAPGCSIGWRID
jgi:hypothetical protein